MDAKDDPYIGFDPITSGEETYFDIETSSWKKKCFRSTGSVSSDYSDVIARLNSALSQNQLLNATLEEERAKLNLRDKEIEKLKSDLSDLNKALLSNSSACEILKAALQPVARFFLSNWPSSYYTCVLADGAVSLPAQAKKMKQFC